MEKIHLSKSAITITRVCLLFLLFFQSACIKNIDLSQKLSISGQIIDDITGDPINNGVVIKVDGFRSPAGLSDPTWKKDLGSGIIYPGGVFNFSFNSWSQSTHYYISFQYNNNSYINTGTVYLNTHALDASLFNSGHHVLDIRAAKMTELRVNFKNINPFNSNDRLQIILPSPTDNILFGYLFPRWENLQFCTYDSVSGGIVGGFNARGSLICNVPSDRRFGLRWRTRKNNVEQSFQDSIICLRDIITVYNLDY